MSAAREYGLGEDFQWPRPPVDGWTADDLDRLPNLIHHKQLPDDVPFPADIDLTAVDRPRPPQR